MKKAILINRSLPLSILICMLCYTTLIAGTSSPDSIGVENRNGERIIIHKIKAKETYFGISRLYNIPVQNLISFNRNKALKIGDTLRVPTGKSYENPQPAGESAAVETPVSSLPIIHDFTEYKVGKGETLYSVSKRFMISVESIKYANGLSGDTLQEEMILKVPNKEIRQQTPEPQVTLSDIIDQSEADTETSLELPANQYGIREMNEKGVGVWIDNLSQESGSMLALHKSAPTGTIVKITNPMTRLTTYVKVVGKFVDNAETQNAVIVISKSAASQIGILDRRFQIEIAYGSPME